MKSTICLAEDREACEPALKLLLLSLRKHSPEITVNVFYPPAKREFVAWLQKFPQVHLQTDGLKSGYGWNVKPQAVMYLLDEGFDEVIWVDSDIIVKGDISRIFAGLNADTLAVSEHTLGAKERDDKNAFRARAWGLPVGRVLLAAISSGVLRVTRKHHHLMERWWELLKSELYQDFQKRQWRDRPFHMLGDQDVLTALLTSKEFADIPIYVLRRGKHIIQFDGVWGYTVAERIRNLVGDGPGFIHSGAGKPWSDQWVEPPNMREYVKKLYLDVSPYTMSAIPYRYELGCSVEWMNPHFVASRILRALGMGRSELAGLPMAVILDLARIPRAMRKSAPEDIPELDSGRPETVSKE